MPDNLTMKILKAHLEGGECRPGEEIAVRVDQTLLQDATGTMASLQFEELDLDRVRVPLAVQYVDHNMIQLDFKNPDDHRYLRHAYFGGGGDANHADYDAVWVERGGRRVDASHFELPLAVSLRSLDEVPSKKRAQYRRRNEMLQELQGAGPVLRTGSFLRFEAT